MLEEHGGVVVAAEASDVESAMAVAGRARADIILIDVGQEEDESLASLGALIAASGDAPAIVLTATWKPALHSTLVRRGVRGVVSKHQGRDTLFKAIEKVRGGEVWLERTTIAAALKELTRPRPGPGQERATLTRREREIVRWMADGLKNRQIAERLTISEATVRNHLSSIFAKLNVSSRTELAVYAHRNGLAPPHNRVGGVRDV